MLRELNYSLLGSARRLSEDDVVAGG